MSHMAGFCRKTCSQSGLVTWIDAEYSDADDFDGLATPIPPNQHGRANKSHSQSFGGLSLLGRV